MYFNIKGRLLTAGKLPVMTICDGWSQSEGAFNKVSSPNSLNVQATCLLYIRVFHDF